MVNEKVRELIQLSVKLIEKGERNREAVETVAGVCEAFGFGRLAVELRDLETTEDAGEATAWIVAAMLRVGEIESGERDEE